MKYTGILKICPQRGAKLRRLGLLNTESVEAEYYKGLIGYIYICKKQYKIIERIELYGKYSLG